jgi:hypothetical protein
MRRHWLTCRDVILKRIIIGSGLESRLNYEYIQYILLRRYEYIPMQSRHYTAKNIKILIVAFTTPFLFTIGPFHLVLTTLFLSLGPVLLE